MRKGKAPDTILRLVDNFDRNVAAYRSPAYNEAQVRKEFLDPFYRRLHFGLRLIDPGARNRELDLPPSGSMVR